MQETVGVLAFTIRALALIIGALVFATGTLTMTICARDFSVVSLY